VAGPDHFLLPGSVAHVQLALSLSNRHGGSAPLRQQSITGVSQPPLAGMAGEMGSSSSGERSWNYLPVPWDQQAGESFCQERLLEKDVEEISARTDGWKATELKSPMLQVLRLQKVRVLLCTRVSRSKIGWPRCVRVITGNVLKTPGAELEKGKAGL